MKNTEGIPRQGEHRLTEKLYFIRQSNVTDCTFTGTNATAPTVGLDAVGGGMLLTNAGADNDACVAHNESEFVKFTDPDGEYTFSFAASFSDITEADWGMGVGIKTATLAANLNDHILIRKDDGGTTLYLSTSKNGSAVTTTLDAVATLGWHLYTIVVKVGPTIGSGRITAFIDGVEVGHIDNTIVEDEELAWMIGCMNGEGSAKTCTVGMVAYDIPAPNHGVG